MTNPSRAHVLVAHQLSREIPVQTNSGRCTKERLATMASPGVTGTKPPKVVDTETGVGQSLSVPAKPYIYIFICATIHHQLFGLVSYQSSTLVQGNRHTVSQLDGSLLRSRSLCGIHLLECVVQKWCFRRSRWHLPGKPMERTAPLAVHI